MARAAVATAIVVLVSLLVGTVPAGGADRVEAGPLAAQDECGTPSNDWVCRTRGRVTYWPYGGPETLSGLSVGGRAKAMPRLTTVRAEAGAEASVRFRRKATCDLAAAGDTTQIVTRVSAESLFHQQLGSTYCRSLNGSFTPVSFFCDYTGECPVVFSSNGTFDSRGQGSDAARVSESTYSRIVITACTGSFELTFFNGEEFKTVKERVSGLAKIRIVITTNQETGEGVSAGGWTFRMRSVSAPGICDGG